jgi:hypothetical protein
VIAETAGAARHGVIAAWDWGQRPLAGLMPLGYPRLAQEGINLILECAAVLAEFIGRGEHLGRGRAGVPGSLADAGNIVRHLRDPKRNSGKAYDVIDGPQVYIGQCFGSAARSYPHITLYPHMNRAASISLGLA